MTIEEFFNDLPIKEPEELTNEDLRTVLKIAYESVKIFNKNDTSLNKSEKVKSYNLYCHAEFDKTFTNLSPNGRFELNKFFNLYGTHIILKHLVD